MGGKNEINTGTKEKLLNKLSRRERIQLSSGNHQYITFSLIVIYIISSFVTIFFYFIKNGLDWNLIAIAGGFLLLFYPLFRICKKLADIAVKGDVLLVNQFFKPVKVTSIKSVHGIKTRSFLKISVTSLTFMLDGTKKKIFLLDFLKGKENKPEEIIRFIRNAA